MGNEAILTLSGVSKSFANVPVLQDVSLTLYAGEAHCLMGENGAGKSTLIKIISGAYRADSGSILYQGRTLSEVTPRWARENGINTIYQEIDLVPHLTAVENILLGDEPLTPFGNLDNAKARARTGELFAKLGVDIPVDVPVSRLPLAQQQMAAIAKAMRLNSRVVIFDEPTSVFTANEVEILFRIINDLKASSMAILYISHHMEEIFEIGDRITVLRDGNLIRTDPVREFTKETLIQAMVGRNIVLSRDDDGRKRGEPVLEVRNLCAGKMVRDVSFTVHRGEVLGFGGLVGGRIEWEPLSWIPLASILLFVSALAIHLFLRKRKSGRYIYALGSNEMGTRLSGVNVGRLKLLVYVLSAFFCALGGMVWCSRLVSGSPVGAYNYETESIAAVVVGGASLSGGEGSVMGTMAGVLIFQCIGSMLNLTGINPFWQGVFKGSLIISGLHHRRREPRGGKGRGHGTHRPLRPEQRHEPRARLAECAAHGQRDRHPRHRLHQQHEEIITGKYRERGNSQGECNSMDNFEFECKTKIIFGRDTEGRVGAEAKKHLQALPLTGKHD